ncbi:MAG TPA: AarF/ABC1/UbiB kinase family protein [Bacteroidales bacterium]|jgi:ubiquinone biosynthesis protein|nr:AarF/ABC1/UbiB kinase family protein [Bacteroidales bacterium]MDI9573841.1 AarF/ABC1/UbiB kinase family protein [Bacteroidota bacterium]OQC61742.1 MAG: putative protein kinase UbiB [Bacteroidetes bacterium ADurb.Bin012]MBP9511809.1 AarF/ABC1/UbiB kinase family protein [Bacteroidales bacterium]MBP9588668.1 AarF/ABC1/UbiB kinase family protein [Bacteroidales bacterium]
MAEPYSYVNFRFRSNFDKVRRSRQIISVFFKFGLDYFLGALRVNIFTRLRKRKKGYKKLSNAERLRMAFEELGPTFIKFGQILSTRPDFLPPDYIRELEKLQDTVAPIEVKKIQEIIETELHRPIAQAFKEFDEQPVASASLSQVHRAVLQNGNVVAVKVQKPDIQNTIELDISILETFANIIEKRFPEGPFYHPMAMVNELKRTIRKELDFLNEAHNFEKFRTNFKDVNCIKIPEVYWDLTTERLLVMEFIDGIKISEITHEKYRSRFDLKKVAHQAAEALLKQILLDGFFHADPHPGNLFVIPPNTIVMLDVGMTGHLDDQSLLSIAKILRAINHRDFDQIIRGLQELGIVMQEVDKTLLRHDIKELLDIYTDRPFKTISLARMNQDILDIAMRHRLAIPSNFVMMIRAMSIAETIGKQLESDFDILEMVKPFTRKIYLKLYSPRSWKKRTANMLDASVELIEHLPQNIYDLLEKLKEGQFEIHLEHHRLENLANEIKSSSNRIAVSLIIAALIVGSSILIHQKIGPMVSNVSVWGIIGFVIAIIMGIGLLISSFRKNRRRKF